MAGAGAGRAGATPPRVLTRTERNHAEAAIERASKAAHDARDTAEHYGLEQAAERISWALDFLADAAAEAAGRER